MHPRANILNQCKSITNSQEINQQKLLNFFITNMLRSKSIKIFFTIHTILKSNEEILRIIYYITFFIQIKLLHPQSQSNSGSCFDQDIKYFCYIEIFVLKICEYVCVFAPLLDLLKLHLTFCCLVSQQCYP